jgi:competence protein ComEC
VRFSRVFCSGILLVAFMGCGVTAPAQVGESIRITFLDVGQGDAVLIRSPEGQTALVDAGWSSPVTSLRALDVDEIDLLVATHPHADHIGGMVDVINSIPVHFYMDNGQTHTTATYEGLASTLQQRTDITYLIAEPRSISLGSVEIEVLPLLPIASTDFNNRSIGLVVRYGDFSAFLSGDSEVEELSSWVRRGVVPDVTVLKAPHHGSYNGFTSEFLADAEPEVVAISVGSNTYGHPHAEALEAYTYAAETVLRTDLDGQITIVGYEDGRYEVVLGEEVTAMVQGCSVGLGVVGMRYIYE